MHNLAYIWKGKSLRDEASSLEISQTICMSFLYTMYTHLSKQKQELGNCKNNV